MLQSIKTTPIPVTRAYLPANRHPYKGLVIALVIVSLWSGSLAFLLSSDLAQFPVAGILPAIVVQTFLYTGLFITAHDAMHHSLFPKNRWVNDAIGTLAVFLYACFPYQRLFRNHWLHHFKPASNFDPDFHDGQHKNPVLWYGRFIVKYCNWFQLIGISFVLIGLKFGLKIPTINLLLFWFLPSILSSFQLFYFGIYLPHREPETGYTNRHRARSSSLPPIWSFLSCYHFGYHEEHHDYPFIPWWQLPEVRRQHLESGG